MDGIGGPGDEGGVGGAGRAPRLGLEPGQGAEGPTGSGSDPAGFLMNARADYEVDRTLDPFAEEMETEGGQGGGFRDEGHTSSWRPQQLQLGTWGNTTGTIHAVSGGGDGKSRWLICVCICVCCFCVSTGLVVSKKQVALAYEMWGTVVTSLSSRGMPSLVRQKKEMRACSAVCIPACACAFSSVRLL